MEKQILTNIHPNAKIGKNVTIESFTTIYDNVEIGDGTWIGPNVTIFEGARIGKNCKISFVPGLTLYLSSISPDKDIKKEKKLKEGKMQKGDLVLLPFSDAKKLVGKLMFIMLSPVDKH